MTERIANIELMKKIREEFLRKLKDSKDIRDITRNNLINYMKTMINQEFKFNEINLEDLKGLNIDPTEMNIMINLSLQKVIGGAPRERVDTLLYFMNLTEYNQEDLDDFLLAGHDLYQQQFSNFNPLTSGTLIQYFSALIEEFLSKLYSFKIKRSLTKFLSFANLINRIFKFPPYQTWRKKRGKLENWQVPLIWSYEIRNFFMHNVNPVPEKTLKQLFYVLNSAILLASFKMEFLRQR